MNYIFESSAVICGNLRPIKMFLNKVWKNIIDFIFPPFCAICNSTLKENEKVVCESCFQNIKFVEPPFCKKCGKPLLKVRCENCRSNKFVFKKARVLGVYDGTLREIIHLLKYNRKLSLAKRLGKMMNLVLHTDNVLKGADMIVPVPLHQSRLRERGYNQCDCLSDSLSGSSKIPVFKKVLVRRRATKSQIKLEPEQRLKNVEGAFVVKDKKKVEGKKVLLVDDVMTTGSTLNACSDALLRGGADEVYCLTAAVA